MTTHHPIASANFSKKTLRSLAKRGVYVIGSHHAPGANGSYVAVDAMTVYTLNDNGTARVRNFGEVIALAN